MLGAVIGDIIGSVFEWNRIKTTDFDLFNDKSCYTDDSVLTFGTARAILDSRDDDFSSPDYATVYKDFGCRYPDSGYGGSILRRIRRKLNATIVEKGGIL